ncbi:hypothetical protein PoB_006754200 [Plakobranchus ocellatus]|uniref:Uncharacterized protein n=1 Tax=Plakobranchus ocellatus TaxID=259542 RepID=A0AAV4DA15_9GAST|nr:hypothetical protein PoB_006754200 [Plakobranchus ocellatus]
MSSLRSSSLGVMRPPKPPCWRDFVVPSSRSVAATDGLDPVLDSSGRVPGGRMPVIDPIETTTSRQAVPSSALGTRSSRLTRRPRARIHRTRSEHIILPEDLPGIASKNPPVSGIPENATPSGRTCIRALPLDGQLYVEENNKRCQSWLASIEAAEPLDEVDYDSVDDLDHSSQEHEEENNENNPNIHSRISIFNHTQDRDTTSAINKDAFLDTSGMLVSSLDQATVEVEIPEETFQWDDDVTLSPLRVNREIRPRSPADSDTCRACKKSARGITTTAVSSGRKFSAPPLCGTCTDCISCGSTEPLSSAASDTNIQSGRAITKEENKAGCCIHFPGSSKNTSNKRTGLKKNLQSKASPKDRSTSLPATSRGSIKGSYSSSVFGKTESISKYGPCEQARKPSPGVSRRARSMSRRCASHRNVFCSKDVHL